MMHSRRRIRLIICRMKANLKSSHHCLLVGWLVACNRLTHTIRHAPEEHVISSTLVPSLAVRLHMARCLHLTSIDIQHCHHQSTPLFQCGATVQYHHSGCVDLLYHTPAQLCVGACGTRAPILSSMSRSSFSHDTLCLPDCPTYTGPSTPCLILQFQKPNCSCTASHVSHCW